MVYLSSVYEETWSLSFRVGIKLVRALGNDKKRAGSLARGGKDGEPVAVSSS